VRDLNVTELVELHEDARRCAEVAGLLYVDVEQPGISRQRRGKGFSYHGFTDDSGSRAAAVDGEVKARIGELAIPPAWQHVWICADPNGHVLATGQDDRGRKQYIYHPAWRELRDEINFYRLLVLAEVLPKIRAHVQGQLRRRKLDRERTIAGMIGILDATYIRIGNETYAEENDSFGLSTLTQQHVTVRSRSVTFDFPAKSGTEVAVRIDDARIVRLIRALLTEPHQRLFTVDGAPIDSADLNATLLAVCGEHITAKDFRTWGGTLAAFSYLREGHGADRAASKVAVEAVDEAAQTLHNTRAVARAHYVHPHLLRAYVDGSFEDYLRHSPPTDTPHLTADERALQALLRSLFAEELSTAQK